MNSRLKLRIALFGTATAAVALTIAIASASVWKHLKELRGRLDEVQSESFDIANHFQRFFFGLNNHALRFELEGDRSQWAKFLDESSQLDAWIDRQQLMLKTDTERAILDEINHSYDDYLKAARAIHDAPNNAGHLIAKFEDESEVMIRLGYKLAAAHRDLLQAFFGETNASLLHLRILLVCAFLLLVGLAAGLWAVIYRDMIAPLHAKLIESHALLEQQEKLASLGVLAAGLAHEIRNPLTAMKARLFTLGKRLEPGTVQSQDAAVISREVDRLERILKDFLQFARPSDPSFVRIDAMVPMRQVQALLGPQFEQNNIHLVIEESPPLFIKADPQQITQVLINLVKNAAESICKSGVITLRLLRDSVVLRGRNTDVVVLEVGDTGKGITPDVEKRLFDPFHTTKEGGTGLGLSVAGRIVERHGGALRYRTRVGHGTTFGVVLPQEKLNEPGS